jgi:hypothetical protein
MRRTYRIESEFKLASDWLPAHEFTRVHTNRSLAEATAIEGVADPATQEVRIRCVETGEVVWRSVDEFFDETANPDEARFL